MDFDDSEWTVEELRLQLACSAMDNGWEEPGMDAYDHYDENRRHEENWECRRFKSTFE